MAGKQYGKINNGQLVNAPSQIIDNGCMYCGVPDHIYRKYGYKPLAFAAQPENIPHDNRPVFVWTENEATIDQVWSFEKLLDDHAEQLRKSKGRFNIALLRLKEGIQDYCAHKNEEMLTATRQNKIVEKAYENLLKATPHSNISDAMKRYKNNIPCNFFAEVGISEDLLNDGFIINISNDLLFFADQNTFFTSQHMESFDFSNGKVYLKDTNRDLYPVSSYEAIKFVDSESPIIMSPITLYFTLQQIAELYDSFVAPNLYFTMAFTYLHTIMDEFISSLIRFYISSFPQGVDFSKNLSSAEILSINSMDDLTELKNNIIDEKVASFGHNSYQDKIDFLSKRGLQFTLDKTLWHDEMIWFCEKRNAIVHNASIVNQTIIRKLAGTSYMETVSLGEDVSPDYDTLMTTIALIETVCNDIYNVAKSKFKF